MKTISYATNYAGARLPALAAVTYPLLSSKLTLLEALTAARAENAVFVLLLGQERMQDFVQSEGVKTIKLGEE